jgi:hypothetical protein
VVHDEEQNKRNYNSEKNVLERKIRTIKDKVERNMSVKISDLMEKLEASRKDFESEREHHQATNKALEQANEEIDSLVVRLAEAQEENHTPIQMMRQQQFNHQPNQYQRYQQQQQHHQHHQHHPQYQQHQQHPQYQQQQQHQQQSPLLNKDLSSTYGGSSISHQSRELFQQRYNPTIEETEEEESREQELIQRMMKQQQQQETTKPSRPQSAGRTRPRPPQWSATDEAAQQQTDNVGRPPLPPSSQRNRDRNSCDSIENNECEASPTTPAPPLSARSDIDDEGVDLTYNDDLDSRIEAGEQSKRNIPQHVLDESSSSDGMGSPGQRAAAAIAGAMKFVKRRSQKRRERQFDSMLGGT